MTGYDPEKAPETAEWLAMGEAERMDLVAAYHKQIRTRLPKPQLHAAIHVIVENQLAMKIEVVWETFERLTAGGLDRHGAIHAIGAVLAKHMWNLMRKGTSGPDPNEPYYRGLKSLTASSWMKGDS